MTSQVQTALATLAVRDGKPQDFLLRALGDAVPARRLAAAELLSRCRGEEHQTAVKKLLRDPDSQVRFRTALVLLNSQEKEALPRAHRPPGGIARRAGLASRRGPLRRGRRKSPA